jgi:hypothetical protein
LRTKKNMQRIWPACWRTWVVNRKPTARLVDPDGKERWIMGKAFVLWLLGVPFTVLVVLWVFGVLR